MTSVLIVDDSVADRKLAGGLLERQLEIAVSYADNGEAALAFCERHVPDVIVTDLVMPKLNGLELIEALRRQHPLTPVIMMTSRGSEEIAVSALEQGAASYVPKRIMSDRLASTVDRILQAAREERNHARLMQRMIRDECAFSLENDLAQISTLVRYLRQGVRGVGLCDDADHPRIGTAIEEALLNAFYHGNLELDSSLRVEDRREFDRLARERCQIPPYCDRRIYVDAQFSKAEAVFTVRDEGDGFDASELPDPSDPENLLRPTGRGLVLMRSFMDELRFNERGNEVTMIKRRREPVSVA